MSENMVRTQIYLPSDVYEKLKERAARDGIAMAAQIREALADYVLETAVAEEGAVLSADDPLWTLIGAAKAGPVDGSVNHDQYIYGLDGESAP